MEVFIKAAARPIISIIFAVTIAAMVLEEIRAPGWFLALAIPTITWWFAERAIMHAKENSMANLDKLAEKLATAIKNKGTE